MSPLVFETESKFAHPVAGADDARSMQIGPNFCWIPDDDSDEDGEDLDLRWDEPWDTKEILPEQIPGEDGEDQ